MVGHEDVVGARRDEGVGELRDAGAEEDGGGLRAPGRRELPRRGDELEGDLLDDALALFREDPYPLVVFPVHVRLLGAR